MKPAPLTRFLCFLLIFAFAIPQSWATCGGGGGGGVGGMGGGSMSPEQTYPVPWKLMKPEVQVKEGLVMYWFPSSVDEYTRSSLRNSRILSLYASQCVTMGLGDVHTPIGQKLAASDKLPVAVLATPEGSVVTKVTNQDGKLKVDQVEKALETEMKRRESAVEERLKSAKDKARSGDSKTAIELYRAVLDQKCLFPKKAKDAAKELKKLGVSEAAELIDAPIFAPVFDRAASARIENTMIRGMAAEMKDNYLEAVRLYSAAHRMDPADPVPLRYLGEVYRHHIGEWEKARETFESILKMPADPLSRAVALHGLGKMTIHEGDFKKGLGLMESSVQEYPIALAYRNLAVYWNSEGDQKKAGEYTKLALSLEPKDPFNLVFAAAFMAGAGRGDEALKIARENENLMPASYNLAAVYAQLGQKEKALALLQRHFFQYERYQSVRAKEMMEARVDAVFASINQDRAFVALTSGADGRLPIPNFPGMKPAGTN
ncbi:MAG: tetratricopeptide repeat protein [Acidobacteriia bacterium]|nr:tetratricopeptide repeat protein [Terriglobia bacterium]